MRIIASIVLAAAALWPAKSSAQALRWPGLILHSAAPFNAVVVEQDDQLRAEAGELELYARTLPMNLASWADGEWTNEGTDRVCRFRLRSSGAQAMELLLHDIDVPAGARITMFAPDGRLLSETLPLDLREGSMEYSTPLIHADDAVLEYRQPFDATYEGRFVINGLAHAYRYVEDTQREGACHVNVACSPESNGWQDVITATVRISVVTAQGNGWCTGTLVNNVRQDCTPYILTAFHCGRLSSTGNFNQYKFYFNFQYANCNGGAYSTAQFVTGAQLVAFSDDYVPALQGLGGSDFMLLRLNNAVPEAYAPYWAGWDASSVATVTADGVCVHHPTGAPKRISSYTQSLTTGHPMSSSGLMSHYRLLWAQTQNGFGVTEQGSSGAGLFKPHPTEGPVLIGTLTGSSSGTSCTNNQGTSYFGKMSYHWTNNPNTTALKLKSWLDPDATGTNVLAGSAHPCSVVSSVPADRDQALFNVWPNPVSDLLNIEAVPSGTVFSINDIAGLLVGQGSVDALKGTIDVRHLPAGVYLLTFAGRNGTILQRTKVVVDP